MKKSINTTYIYLLFCLAIFLLYFYPMFLGMVLEGDDFKITKGLFFNWSAFFYGEWSIGPWLGFDSAPFSRLKLEKIILFLLPDWNGFSTTMTFALIGIGSLVGSYYLFRSFKFEKTISFIASFLFTFSPIFFTYIRAGHIGKLTTIVLFTFTLMSINVIWSEKRIVIKIFHLFFAAMTLSLAIIQLAYQTYVYLFPILVAYTLFLFFNKNQGITLKDHFKQNRASILILLLVPVVFFIIGFKPINSAAQQLTGQSLISLLSYNEEPISSKEVFRAKKIKEEKSLLYGQTANGTKNQIENKVSKKDQDIVKWDWATQWSLPKIETIDFFVPGIFGFLSNDPDNPYWGGVGRSLFWEQNREGLFNYSLTSHYLGIFLGIFLIYGFFFLNKKLKWLWLSLILVNLLLSYGKYFPLYELLYNFPYAEKVRNPNKFLLVFHVCVAIFAAFGLNDFYLKIKNKTNNPKIKLEKETTFFKFFLIIMNIILFIGLLWLVFNQTSIKNTLNNYFNQNIIITNKIYSNIIFSLIKAIILYNLSLYLLFLIAKRNFPKNVIKKFSLVLVSILLLDQYLVNRHFFNFKITTSTDEVLTNFFLAEKKKSPFRVKILTPNSSYINYFKWELSRQNNIELMEHWAIRTGIAPEGDRKYFSTINNNDLRVFKLANIKFLLSNKPFYHPEITLAQQLRSEATQEDIYIYQLNNFLDRFYLVDEIKFLEDRDILEAMNDNSFNIKDKVIFNIKKEVVGTDKVEFWINDYVEKNNYSPAENNNQKELTLEPGFTDQEFNLTLNITKPKILVFLNRASNNWNAYSEDGTTLPQANWVNYYFNAYLVTPEVKKVTVKYGRLSPNAYSSSDLTIYGLSLLLFIVFRVVRRKIN